MSRATNAAVAAFAVALSGCASQRSDEQPPAAFFQAEASIQQAEQADAQRYASHELNLARQQLQEARNARQQGELARAERLAAQAQVDAELAAAKAGNEQLQMVVQELRASLDTLRQELNRSAQ